MIFNREKYNVVEIQSTFKLILVEDSLKGRISVMAHHIGWGNGYVCLPEWHPWFGFNVEDLYNETNVYGGITLATYDDEENLWVIGFDTGHLHSGGFNYDSVLGETKDLEQQCLDVDGVKEKIRLEKIKNLLNG